METDLELDVMACSPHGFRVVVELQAKSTPQSQKRLERSAREIKPVGSNASISIFTVVGVARELLAESGYSVVRAHP